MGSTLEITQGIAEFSNRVGLKHIMSQFGEVEICWIPPIWDRDKEVAYVKFRDEQAAKDALMAMARGELQMHGLVLKGRYRSAGSEPQARPRGSGGGGGRRFGGGGSRDLISREELFGGRRRDRGDSRRRRSRGRDRRRDSRDRRRDARDGNEDKATNPRWQYGEQSYNKTQDFQEPVEETAIVTVDKFLGERQSLGLKLKDLTVVEFEEPNAEAFGWKRGDCITSINGVAIVNVTALVHEVNKIKANGILPVRFTVQRKVDHVANAYAGATAVRAFIANPAAQH